MTITRGRTGAKETKLSYLVWQVICFYQIFHIFTETISSTVDNVMLDDEVVNTPAAGILMNFFYPVTKKKKDNLDTLHFKLSPSSIRRFT